MDMNENVDDVVAGAEEKAAETTDIAGGMLGGLMGQAKDLLDQVPEMGGLKDKLVDAAEDAVKMDIDGDGKVS